MFDSTYLTLISDMNQIQMYIYVAPNGKSLNHFSKTLRAVYSKIGMVKKSVYDQYLTVLYTCEVALRYSVW